MLRMFTNGQEFAIANTIVEAMGLVYRHNTGQDPPECWTPALLLSLQGDGWSECVPDRQFTLHEEVEDAGDLVQTKTVSDWVRGASYPQWFASVDG